MSELCFLDEVNPQFPDTANSLDEPNGLLAVGGNLSTGTLINAYSRGIFPWYSEDQPILWWSPCPRTVLLPEQLHIGRSVRKLARKRPFEITVDTAFDRVIKACADTDRNDQDGTWITKEVIDAYCLLFQQGHAHSVEAWQNGYLVGGLYGISIGSAFFGESMFSLKSGASKIAFVSLVQQLCAWEFKLIDCQVHTHYLESFGSRQLARTEFEHLLASAIYEDQNSDWQYRWSLGDWGFDGS